MSSLVVESLSISFGISPLLQELSFTLESGEIACLLGASGCGKTTALRSIAGFEKPQHGRILLGGRILNNEQTYLPAHLRRIGMVFQDYALFPHLNIAQNIAFGLKKYADKTSRTAEMLELIGLSAYGKRYPHEISGGQQQRVALARALAPRPELILLDEPFSNLDTELRHKLAAEVHSLLKTQGTSALFVTHDKQEALTLADKIGILHQGRLQQWATPDTLYHRPATPYVAEFVGAGTLLDAVVRRHANTMQADIGFAFLPLPDGSWQENDPIRVLIRTGDIRIDHASSSTVRLIRRDFLGECWRYTVATGSGQTFTLRTSADHCHPIGTLLPVSVECRESTVFADDPLPPKKEKAI